MTRLASVTHTLAAIILLLVCRTVTAAQCSAVFPDAVSTHKNGGKITFSFNSSIVGSPDNILDTSQVQFKNAGSSVLTCSTAECSASGNLSASFDSVSFKTTSIKADVNVGYQEHVTIGDGTNNSNEFDQINSSSSSSATITFSSDYDEYIIDKLVLGYDNILNLQGGSTYWFNEFVLSSSTRVVVQGTGTAIVLVNKKVSFPFESLINSPSRGVSGDASKLVLYAVNKVDLAQSTFSGSLYSNNTVSTGFDSRIFGAVSADKVDVEQQTIVTYQASEIADTDFGLLCAESLHHYDITHTSQAFTCEPASITIKACADASCTLSDDEVTLNFQANNTTVSSHTFEGDTSFLYTNTTAETVVLSIDSPTISPSSTLTCNDVSGGDACDLKFVDSGFQFFGENIVIVGGTEVPDPVPDQLAESDFEHLKLRAIESDKGVCKPAFEGDKVVEFGYSCVDPDSCVKELSGVSTNPSNIVLNFNSDGIADLSNFKKEGEEALSALNYPDAGKINLTAKATVSGANILVGNANVDVYPSYLKLAVQNTDLLYTGTSDSDLYTAGLDFIYSIGAYGAQNNLLPNYQPENLAFKVHNPSIVTDTINGAFAYDTDKTVTSIGSDFAAADSVTFSNGEHDFENAYYTETGLFTLDVRDTSYLGNIIRSQSDLELGTFIPAYYSVIFDPTIVVALQNTYINLDPVVLPPDIAPDPNFNDFTYIGQSIPFATEPTFTLVPKNAVDQTTQNYIYEGWVYAPTIANLRDPLQLIFTDVSVYSGDLQATHVTPPDTTSVIESVSGRQVTFIGTRVIYNKVNANNEMFAEVNPFPALFNITYLAPFFTDINGVCFKTNFADTSCNQFPQLTAPPDPPPELDNITGANLRFGRFALQNNYGPETESLQVPFFVEYYQSGNWLVNTLDNNTPIVFDESDPNNHLTLSVKSGEISLTDINSITSDGEILLGEADKVLDLFFNAPNKQGELLLRLNPLKDPSGWSSYLNYDWNGDGVICNAASCPDTDDDGSERQQTDFPSATISFGLFRGNDRIIQWREVFN